MTSNADPGGVGEAELEYPTVGALLCAPGLLPGVRDWLEPGDFTVPACRAAYTVMLELHAAGEPVDPVTAMTRLRRQWPARRDGWPAMEVLRMVETVPVPAAAVTYARLVVDAAMLRALEGAGKRLTHLGRGHGEPGDAWQGAELAWAELTTTRRRWERAHVAAPPARGASRPSRSIATPAMSAPPGVKAVNVTSRGR